MSTPTTALQKYDTIATLLQSENVQKAIARALPRHMTAERMIRVAMTAIQKTPKLAECEPRSLINALVQASELGLEPNTPLGHAYIIPYWNNKTKKTEAQLMPGYRGFIALARRSGQVQGIYAEIVYSKDFFEITYGLDKDLKHKPFLNEEDRGEMIGAYAVAKFKDGYTDFEYMDAVQIGKIRARSKSPDAGPWVTDTGEMWRKTPIRRLAKRLPLSIEDAAFQKAVEIDNDFHDTGFDKFEPLELGTSSEAPEVITEAQRVSLVEASKAAGTDIAAIVQSAGFEMIADITVGEYDAILEAAKTKPETTAAPEEPKAETAPVEKATKAPKEPEADAEKSVESKMEDLLFAIKEKITEKTGGEVRKVTELMGGRLLERMDLSQLESFWKELNG